MHAQLFKYFTDNDLLFSSQYGFRSGHSTEHASIELVDRILNIMESGDVPLGIFMDLSKAFDTLDHQILLHKLKHHGVAGSSLELFKSYLWNREQFVFFDGNTSSCKTIRTGVPQGSILGPLLFLIYINDINKVSSIFSTISYADDTTLIAPISSFFSDTSSISDRVNAELSLISDWLIVNKLSLNVGKTNFMMFHKSAKSVPDLSLEIRGQPLNLVDNFTFLGLTIDYQLNWKPHLSKISAKISKTIGVLSRLKNFLPIEILRLIYNGLILPHINYSILCWGFVNTNRILLLQKKAVRLISGKKFNTHSVALFKSLCILKVDDIFCRVLLKFYFLHSHKLLPKYFASFTFTTGKQVHEHNTRFRNSFRPARNSKVYTAACVKSGINNILSYTSSAYDPGFKYNTNFKTSFSGDKLTLYPKQIFSVILEKVHTHSLQGFTFYTKIKFLELYIDTPCRKTNCWSCS